MRTGRPMPTLTLSESQVATAKQDPQLVVQTAGSSSFMHFGMNMAGTTPWGAATTTTPSGRSRAARTTRSR